MGLSLLGVLAALLVLVDRTGDGRILSAVGGLLLLASVGELHRMGSWASLGLGPRLLPGALVLAWSHFGLAADGAQPGVAEQYLGVALAALMSHGLAQLAGGLAWPALAIGWGALLFLIPGEPASSAWLSASRGPLAAVAGATLVLHSLAGARTSAKGRTLGVVLMLALWVTVPLLAVAEVFSSFGLSGLISLLILSKIGDIVGYYVGSSLGKSHPFPGISPGKTTAGCVGSLVAGCAGGLLCVYAGWLPAGRWGLAGGLLLGALTNVFAQAGDLFESAIKRRTGVKDSATYLGPAGGVLDLVDSLLFTVPLALWAWDWFLR